jgi:hypothetical protein
VTGNDHDTDRSVEALDAGATDTNPVTVATADRAAGFRSSPARIVATWLAVHARIARLLALIAVAGLAGGAYLVGAPPQAQAQLDSHAYVSDGGRFSAQVPAATAAAVNELSAGVAGSGPSVDNPSVPVPAKADGQGGSTAAVDAKQIVKTGQLSLEVADIDAATGQAQSAISVLGGSIDQSDQSGSGDSAMASIVFRVPADKWDQALAALRKIGTKVLSQQTNATDVTSQVVDLNARLDNLNTTERALQAIMARASAIPDVIAVENQLSDTQGQIEQLTAQANLLKNQAAMSTITVSFQLPAKSVTTVATQDWTIGGQVDQAGAALVRIGQGLATMGVWILVVVLPIGIGALVLFGILAVARRILGRSRRGAVAGA